MNSWEFIWMPPSPATTQISASGRANLAPMAAGSAKPMVPRPPEVISVRGVVWRMTWACHIWCWPTSVTQIASGAACCRVRSTSMGPRPWVVGAGGQGSRNRASWVWSPLSASTCSSQGSVGNGVTSGCIRSSTRFRSPCRARSTWMILPTSARSISTWIFLA